MWGISILAEFRPNKGISFHVVVFGLGKKLCPTMKRVIFCSSGIRDAIKWNKGNFLPGETKKNCVRIINKGLF